MASSPSNIPFHFVGELIMAGTIFKSSISLAAAVFCGLSSAVHAGPLSFSDGFEAPTLDPFWTTNQASGFITPGSTTHVHSGGHSVQFTTTDTGLQKYVSLDHIFPHPVFGRFSVWAYDNGAGVSSSNYIDFQIDRIGTHQRASLFGADNDSSGTYSLDPNDNTTLDSGVSRTLGWHQFLFDITPALTTFKIDGAVVFTDPGAPLDHVSLSLSGPSWRPAWTTSFDDFSFIESPATTTPEPATITLLGSGLCAAFGCGIFRRIKRPRKP
jgi:hypothetical protein